MADYNLTINTQGPTLSLGLTGAQGTAGQGVPTGGTSGQVLAKASSDDYDTEWVNPASAGGALTAGDIDTLAELNAIITDATLIDTNDSRLSDARTPLSHTHTASAITDFDTEVSNNSDVLANTSARHSHSNKALLDTYTQTEVNLADAVSKKHAHANQAILDATTASFTIADETKLDGIEAGSEVNNISDVNALDLTDGGETNLHIHDNRYYTETEIDAALSLKANVSHTHAISEVVNLQTSLDAKQATLVSGTNIKTINGESLLGSGDIEITSGGGGAPTGAEYLTLSSNGTLTHERVLTAGTGISFVDGGAGTTLTVSTSITQYSDEMAQDAVGGILVDSPEIDFTYNDTTPSITASIVAGSIDETKLDTSVNASLDLADSALQSTAIGVSIQAHSAVLDATTASFTTADETKLDGIEAGADVTDTANVTAAGALMDSEVTNLAAVKAFDPTDYATSAQGILADSALQSSDIGVSVQAYDVDTAKLDVAQEFTATQNFNATTLTDGATINWDLSANQVASVTLGGNRTLAAPTNLKDGATYILIIKQDATGSRTLTFNGAYKFPGGTAPTLTTSANAVDIISFVSDGTSLFGVAQLDFS